MTTRVENKKQCKDGDSHPKIGNFDDILEYVGEAGRYQWFLFFMLLPFSFAYAFLYFGQYFMMLVPEEHWCKVPEFENANLSDWEKIELSIPSKLQHDDDTKSHVSFSRCKMYLANYTEVLITRKKPGPDTPIGSCQYGWEYNMTSVPYRSIGAELEWVCDKTYLITTAQLVFFIGSIVGSLTLSYVADHYGRLPALVTCNAIGFFASISTAFTSSFWSFTLSRFIVGLSFDNCFNIIFIILIEYVGRKYRTIASNMSFGIYFAFAAALLPWIAYWISDWKILSVVCALPMVVAFIAPWIIPESARWYIQRDRTKEAVKVLKKFAKVNKKEVSDEVYEEFEKSCSKIIQNETSHNNYTVLDLFKLPRLRRISCVLIVYWILIMFIFDGHVWNMKLLHPDVFTSFSLASITELPASILVTLLLDRWGRRWMGCLSMLLCGVLSFVALGMPIGPWAMSMAVIARFGVNLACNIGLQFAAEILPTVARAQGLSLIHLTGHLAHGLGPCVVYLANFDRALPLIVLGGFSFVVAALALMLPETMEQELPETLEDSNNFGRELNFWWFPCIVSSQKKKKKYRQNKLGCVNVGFNPGSLENVEATPL